MVLAVFLAEVQTELSWVVHMALVMNRDLWKK